MPTIKLVAERTATGRVREIYDEIKTVLGTAFVPVNFRAVAHNPDHLEAIGSSIKRLWKGAVSQSRSKKSSPWSSLPLITAPPDWSFTLLP